LTRIIGIVEPSLENLKTLTAEESESQKELRKVRNVLKVPQLSAEPMLNQASQTGKNVFFLNLSGEVADRYRFGLV
jgi:hypothetical protein